MLTHRLLGDDVDILKTKTKAGQGRRRRGSPAGRPVLLPGASDPLVRARRLCRVPFRVAARDVQGVLKTLDFFSFRSMSREKKVFFCALATVSLLLPLSLFTLARPISLPCPTLLTSTTLFYKPPSNEKKSQKRTKKQFVGLATEVGLSSVADALPTVIDRFSPLFAGDHAVAM